MGFESFKSFIHPVILKAFRKPINVEDGETEEAIDGEKLLKDFYNSAEADFNAFNVYLTTYGGLPTFDGNTYIVKRALANLYRWMCQHYAEFKDLNLTGLGISKDQIFQHFNTLLKQEEDELQDLKQESLTALEKRKNESVGSRGIVLNFRPRKTIYGRYK